MISRLKLGTKFTVLLLIVFIVGIGVSGMALSNVLQKRAETQVVLQGQMLMQTMNSVRAYTNIQIVPLLRSYLEPEDFTPEMVPAYSARIVFENFHKNTEYSNLLYKEAVLNPTNPRDQADSFETELIDQFLKNPTTQELSGFRSLGREQLFYSARPLAVEQQSCLRCHSFPAAAPANMIAIYGKEHGFGWQLNSIIGAQLVYVPSKQVFDSAHRSLMIVLGIFVGTFAIAILCINLLLKPTVLRPIHHLAKIAQRLGGSQDASQNQAIDTRKLDKVAYRGDELGQLARVFQAMVREVIAREENLRQQVKALRIEIDEARKAREVAEITETDYFQQLQQKAQRLRKQDS